MKLKIQEMILNAPQPPEFVRIEGLDQGPGLIFHRAEAEEIVRAVNAYEELRDSLGWITTFCEEHAEWFGEGTAAEGAEYEWLESACALLARLN